MLDRRSGRRSRRARSALAAALPAKVRMPYGSARRRHRRRGGRQQGSPFCCLAVSAIMMVVTGLGMMSSGLIHLQSATTDSRGALIGQWNARAAEWPAARQTFAGIDFALCSGKAGCTELGARSTEQLDDLDQEAAAASWSPLFYAGEVAVVGGGRPLASGGDSSGGGLYSFSLSRDGETVATLPPLQVCPAYNVEVLPCPSSCSTADHSSRRRSGSSQNCITCASKCERQHQGVWDGRSCRVQLQLATLGFVVRAADQADVQRDPKGFTLLPHRIPSAMAQLTGGAVGEHTDVAGYVRAAAAAPAGLGGECGGQVAVTVRSGKDPYIAAAELTSYSMNFGNTQAGSAPHHHHHHHHHHHQYHAHILATASTARSHPRHCLYRAS